MADIASAGSAERARGTDMAGSAERARGTDMAEDADLVDLDGGATPAAPAAELEPGVISLDDDVPDDMKLPKHAIPRADGTIELPLLHPVTMKFKKGGTVREETTERLVFHRLTGGDMRVITAKPQEKIVSTAMARSTRMVEMKMDAIYDRMDARDVDAAGRCVMHFMDGGRPTGR
jgi:hypothetical protein